MTSITVVSLSPGYPGPLHHLLSSRQVRAYQIGEPGANRAGDPPREPYACSGPATCSPSLPATCVTAARRRTWTGKSPNDYVMIFAGGELPTAFLRSCGVAVDTKFGAP